VAPQSEARIGGFRIRTDVRGAAVLMNVEFLAPDFRGVHR
jgi:hypothetical protein